MAIHGRTPLNTKVFVVCLSIVLVLLAILIAVVFLLGQVGMILAGIGMGGLTLAIGIVLRASGRKDQVLEALFAVEGQPTAIDSAKQGELTWFRGRLISADEHGAPYSQQQVACWLAKATRIHHRPRREHPLEECHQPDSIEIDDGSGTATIPINDAAVRTDHVYGPKSWYWRNSDDDRRLEQVFAELHPDTEVYKGSLGHFSMSESLLKRDDELTVIGAASEIEQGEHPRITIRGPANQQLIVSNYNDQQVSNLMGFRKMAAFWSVPILLIAVAFLGVAVKALISG